jgi:cell wall-associated NlpC family hydrolase
MAVPSEVKTPVGDAPVVPLVILGVGLYLAWFSIHYWRRDVKWPTDPVKNVLTGKPIPDAGATPATHQTILTAEVQAASEGSTPPTSSGGSAGATGSAIADDALKYQGAGYVWGGNASRPGNWDCSSFVSYVLGHDLGLPLPGGHWGDPGFPPHAHGPTTLQYLLYGEPVDLKDIQPGDLIVSTVHIGICIGGGKMISAQDPQLGTNIGGFPQGFPAGPPHYRRPTGAGSGGTHQAPGTTTAGGRG